MTFYHLTFKCDIDLQPTNLQIFFKKKSKFKKKNFLFEGRAEGAAGLGVDALTDKPAQANFPLQLLRSWGHNNAFMYKLCP